MSKIKRLITLAISIIICVSFYTIGTTVSAVRYDFSGTNTTVYFFPNESNYSRAIAQMTTWGEHEDPTDLAAFTEVENVFFIEDPIGNTVELEVYVKLSAYFNFWNPNPLEQTVLCRRDSPVATASVSAEALDDEDHFLEGFESEHTLTKYVWDYSDEYNRLMQYSYAWGPTIYIGTPQS